MTNKLLDRVKQIRLEKQSEILEKHYKTSIYDEAVLELYQNYIGLANINKSFDIEKEKKEYIELILKFSAEERFKNIIGLDNYFWGMRPCNSTSIRILKAVHNKTPIYFAEDTFLRCIVGAAQILPPEKRHYHYSCGYTVDDLTCYFDATRPSRMELTLNSGLEITQEQKQRARNLINTIIKNKISKYNNQPIYKPNFGRENVPKVLVIDQSYKDFSISKGCADDSTFEKMLECAIKENPNADILIKTHPDAIGKNCTKPICYYQNTQEKDNVYKITEAINPISMIEYVDKVYVCSSQFGFEALMCNKEVHTFGIPFYAGWGLTIDAQKCERRTRKRTLEEIFYIAYILMSAYINPKTNKPCEIEEAIEYLLEAREEYFKEKQND